MRAFIRASQAFLTAASLLAFLGCDTTKPTHQATGADTRQASKNEKAPLAAAQSAPVSKSDYTKQKAEAGEANAQMLLAQMYDKGNGVDQSDAEGFKWWLKAAEQGAAVAQYNVGVAYLSGIGVARDQDKAISWFTKAAEQGYAKGWRDLIFRRENSPSKSTNMAAVTTSAYYPDTGERREASLPYPPGRQPSQPELASQAGLNMGFQEKSKAAENVKAVSEILSNYHETHKYIGNDIYVCGDMACDVWDLLQAKGINGKIQVGNVDKDIRSILEADHAWVLADLSSGRWLALEATGGQVVYPDKNKRYYSGHSFRTPKEFKGWLALLGQLHEAERRHEEARRAYNDVLNQYNQAAETGQIRLRIQLSQKEEVMNQRNSDLVEIVARMQTLFNE